MEVERLSPRADWYLALLDPDCLRLQILLQNNEDLVNEGRRDDPKLCYDGVPAKAGTKSWKGCNALHAAAIRGCVKLVHTVVDLFSTREWFLTTLAELLTEKHGVLNADALAIAVITGNEDVIAALMRASLRCQSNPYQVDGRWVEPGYAKDAEVDDDDVGRKDLRLMTENAMDSLEKHDRGFVLRPYDEAKAFKRLPWQEYLFHFVFSTNDDSELSIKIRNEISNRVKTFENVEGRRDPRRIEKLKAFMNENPYEEGGTTVSHKGKSSLPASTAGGPSRGHGGEDIIVETVREATKKFMESLSFHQRIEMTFRYSKDLDFNFLPFDLYFFLFTFSPSLGHSYLPWDIREEDYMSTSKHDSGFNSDVLWGMRERFLATIDDNCRRFVMLELKDGRGRTALHLAVETSSSLNISAFIHLIPRGVEHADWVNARDGAGRTPLYYAAANGWWAASSDLQKDDGVDLNAKSNFSGSIAGKTVESILSTVSERNGFDGQSFARDWTPLQIAIIHGNEFVVRDLLADKNENRREEFRLDLTCKTSIRVLEWMFELEPLSLAAWMGTAKIAQLLLKDERVRDVGRPWKWWGKQSISRLEYSEKGIPALHIAAYLGKFDLVKLFVDTKGIGKHYDPFVKDQYGNTAIHAVTNVLNPQFPFSLLHCSHVRGLRDGPRRDSPSDPKADEKELAEREGCVELLLQIGLDVWTVNNSEETPYPNSRAPSEFLPWWHEKLAKATMEEQNTLNAAAGAISVTATLVATASYVGPLQPPLSYAANSDGFPAEIQVHNIWVRIFIASDIISFYLAVASIMLAVIPTLPIPHQSVRTEIKHTRRIVTFAVAFLFPSIISVLIAFAASSMAVIPNDHGGLKLSTVIVGGLFCLLVICIFSIRILGLVMHRNSRIKKLYGKSLFLDETIPSKWKESTMGRKLRDLSRRSRMRVQNTCLGLSGPGQGDP